MPRQRARKRTQQRAANKPANTATAVTSAAESLSRLSMTVSQLKVSVSVACFDADILSSTAEQLLRHGMLEPVQQQHPAWSQLPVADLVLILTYCQRQDIVAAGLACLDWSDALRDNNVWSHTLAEPSQTVARSALTASVLERCDPAVVDVDHYMLSDSILMYQSLHADLQHLYCSLKALQMLVDTHEQTQYPAFRSVTRITVEGPISGVMGDEGVEFHEGIMLERLFDICTAFPALTTLEQVGMNTPAFGLLMLKSEQIKRGEIVGPRDVIAVQTFGRDADDQPDYDVVFALRFDGVKFAFRVIEWRMHWQLQWKPSNLKRFTNAVHFSDPAPCPAERATYDIDVDNKHLGVFLDTGMQMRATHLVLNLCACKVWECSHAKSTETRKSLVQAITVCNPGTAHDVVIADSVLQHIATYNSLRLLNINNATITDRALQLFAATRDQLQLPFCAVTLHECSIQNTPSTASSSN